MNETIQQLIAHFPGKEDRIQQLWVSSEDFRELGHDYLICREGETIAPKANSPYKLLRRRLEVEILSVVEAWGRNDPAS